MGQTELHQHRALAGVFAVGGVIVTAQNPLEVFAQDAHQDLGAAGAIDFEDDKTGGAETPDPIPLAVFFVPGLIAVEVSLLGQQFDELSIGRSEGLAGFAEQFGDVAPRHLDADDVLEEVSNPTVRSVDSALEVSDQARQPRPEQARLDDGLGQRGLVITAAVMAPNAVGGVLDDLERFVHQLDLLDRPLVFRSLRPG